MDRLPPLLCVGKGEARGETLEASAASKPLRQRPAWASGLHSGEPAWVHFQTIYASLAYGGLQRAVWGNEKTVSRQITASGICRLPAFSGLLCNPRPAAQADPRLTCVVCQTWMQPRSRNDGGLPTSMLRQQHSRKRKSAGRACSFRQGFLCGVFLEHDTSQALSNYLAEIA